MSICPPLLTRSLHWKKAHAVYVHLDTRRVRKAEASEAARLVSNQLGGDILMVFTNDEASQLHLIYPTFEGIRPTLRRMVIERDLPRRTAVMQVANIFHQWESSGSIHLALESAFDVEAVTREFFREYKRVFDAALDKIGGFGRDESEQEAKKLFTQTLFNRLMFVYFVSRKGWLSFGGDRDYLGALWRDYAANASGSEGEPNFRYDRLRPLFFGGLNNDGSQDLTAYPDARRLIGKVPFLNGGLFEETDLDRRTNATVPDDVIRSIFDDLFDRFNFTVMESTPFDIEVAVDPEMLGKVFEELVTGRHDSGSYYTPRPVVSFMCREALKGFLQGRDTGLEDAAIARFVDDHDTSRVSVAAARGVGRALDEITVVDPACGSGAYLLGMMQELVELQTALYNAGLDSKSLYDLKLQIIERNLYGADLDRFAVNIAMLRLWLSLAIEYDDPGDPPPLPNLDFKIVCGDSLLGPDPSPDNYGDLFRHQVHSVAGEVAYLKARYMEATGQDKDTLREKIAGVQASLTAALADSPATPGAVDWRVEFAEVFDRGGFDVAMANPPYGIPVKGERSNVIGNADSYTNFVALAGEVAPKGVMAYITPTSWETGERFKAFRRFLFSNMAVLSVVNLPYDVFETPYVDTAITIGANGKSPSDSFGLATLEKRMEVNLENISDYLEQVEWSLVASDNNLRIPLTAWAARLFSRIISRATPLGQITSSKRGIEAYKFDILDHQPEDALPYFLGQVKRYDISAKSDGGFVVIGSRDTPFHRGSRILTRRIVSRANRLMSVQTDDTFVVKKDIYSIKPISDGTQELVILLAILNSALMSFLYLSRSTAATKDDFRQVTLAGLRELPIIFPDTKSLRQELSRLVEARERQIGDAKSLDQSIDDIVYDMYEVTDSERKSITQWLARSG